MMKNSRERYGSMTKILHWLIACLLLCQVPLGWYMSGLDNEDPWYYRALDLHLSLGLMVLVLFLIKIVWLLISPSPQLSSKLAKWERRTARLIHRVLIGALGLVPLTGYLSYTSQGDPVSIYELFEIPGVMEFSEAGAERLAALHMYLAYAMAAIAMIHISAALKHHFLDGDDLLLRMGFRRSPRTGQV